MPRLPESEKKASTDDKQHRVYLLPCDCDDAHYLKIIWDDDEADWRWIFIEDTINHSYYTPLKIRLKHAWHLLRKGTVCTSQMVLTEEHVLSLREFLMDLPIIVKDNP